jgi:hypothetical protein
MTTYSRTDVDAAAKKAFPSTDIALILAALDKYGVESHERERERVQLTIIDLSKGDLALLEHFVNQAKQDYRDVLYWSEYQP